MNKYIQKKLAMYNVVRQLMEENAPTWNSIPAVESVFNDFTSKIAELEELGIKQASSLTGFAKSKSKLKVVTIEQTNAIAAVIAVYAGVINDEVLKAKVTYTARNMKRTSKEELLAIMEEIHQFATELSVELTPYGITNEHIDNLNGNITDLKVQMYRVRNEIVKRKQLTNSMTQLTKDTDAVLKSGLDQLMKLIKSIDPKFYEKYNSARMLIEYGIKHKLPPSNNSGPTGFLGA